MPLRPVPELLSPAGSLDAARAAIANGADAIYLGAERFNARDDGAQLTLDELHQACRLTHSRGARVYLTLNTLVKPAELTDALLLLGECVDRGIDAVIVQDLGLVRLIRRVYPTLEIHGSTQMTVHDPAGAAVLERMGVARVVLARENTMDDIRAIRSAVPALALESFVHGALCISYSGQCLMSGMISERSANRGSCAQSCRKDYSLTNSVTGETLDTGFLISARDLAAHEHLEELADVGIRTLKVEGRKKKPEYVATVTRSYRAFLDQVARGEHVQALEHAGDLVQIFSRGFTGGMYGGRAGRDYITRDQPDNRGVDIGVVTGWSRGGLFVEMSTPLESGDGIALEPPMGEQGTVTGFAVSSARTLSSRDGITRQVIDARTPVPNGWRVIRTSHAALLARARESFAALAAPARGRKTRVDVRAFGGAGSPLKLLFAADGEEIDVRTEITLVPAAKRALDQTQLREQLGRMGETPFALGSIDDRALAPGLFIPVSEINGLRQRAIEQLLVRRDWAHQALQAERASAIEAAIATVASASRSSGRAHESYGVPAYDAPDEAAFVLAADVSRIEDAYAAAAAGATEIALDPFLRHPLPPVTRVATLARTLAERGIAFRLRTPTIVRPGERRHLDKWLALDRLARGCVHHREPRLRLERLDERRILVRLRACSDHRVREILAIESGDDGLGVLELQLTHDVRAHVASGGGGERNGWRRAQALAYVADAKIARAEIVPPLADAMRLIHREQRHTNRAQALRGGAHVEALGRDVEQLHLAPFRSRESARHLRARERGVDERGRQVACGERIDLVLHQRDERRDHDGEPGKHQRGHLEAQGFSAASGQNDQRVALLQHRLDGALLSGAEVRVAEARAQELSRVADREGHAHRRTLRDVYAMMLIEQPPSEASNGAREVSARE